MNTLLQPIYDSILEGDAKNVPPRVQAALDADLDPATILNEGMIAAMAEVGRFFEEGEYFVPEMLISARAMQAGLAVLKPRLAAANVQSAGKVVGHSPWRPARHWQEPGVHDARRRGFRDRRSGRGCIP
jgi:5-methyltetrahydrofolate--homocysteine methyltransferase